MTDPWQVVAPCKSSLGYSGKQCGIKPTSVMPGSVQNKMARRTGQGLAF